MKRLGSVVVGLALAIGGIAACGDNKDSNDGGGSGSGSDAGSGSDGGPNTSNFTGYVIDLVTNHTDGSGTTRAFTEFSTLPDPDGDSNNTAAYASLF